MFGLLPQTFQLWGLVWSLHCAKTWFPALVRGSLPCWPHRCCNCPGNFCQVVRPWSSSSVDYSPVLLYLAPLADTTARASHGNPSLPQALGAPCLFQVYRTCLSVQALWQPGHCVWAWSFWYVLNSIQYQMEPSLTNLTTVRLGLVWKMRTCLCSKQQKQLWEQFSSAPGEWHFWCHFFQEYLCPCCLWVVSSGPKSPVWEYFKEYLWKDKGKLTWSWLFAEMGVWRAFPIHELILPTYTFWGHSHWKLCQSETWVLECCWTHIGNSSGGAPSRGSMGIIRSDAR